MDVDEAQARMEEIQRIMERATLFTLLPGAPAVIGGLLVLAGCAVSYAMCRSLDFAAILYLSIESQLAFCVMWFLIGVVGVLVEVVLTARAAAKQQLAPSDRPLRVAAFSLTPSVVVAMVLTYKFLIPVEPRADEIRYIVPVWMNALRHGRIHGGSVFHPATADPGAGVSRAGRGGVDVLPAVRCGFGRPCRSVCSILFSGSIFFGNSGRPWSHERAH